MGMQNAFKLPKAVWAALFTVVSFLPETRAQDTVSLRSPLYVSYAYDETGNRVARILLIPKNKENSITPKDTTGYRNTQEDGLLADASYVSENDLEEGMDESRDKTDSAGPDASSEHYIDQVGKTQVLLYPNPVKGSFFVEVQSHELGSEALRYRLYGLSGKILQEGEIPSAKILTVDMEDYGSGTYLFEMDNGSSKQVWKVVKL